MEAAPDGESSEVQTTKRSRFRFRWRWIDAARYGVASVVAVLIISVIVNAIQVVLRPDSLSLSVIGGAVFAQPAQPPPPPLEPTLLFHLDVRARNPSGRARMYYLNITVYLFDNSTPPLTPRPGPDSIIFFHLRDKAVDQLDKVDVLREVKETRGPMAMAEHWFDMLYGRTGAAIADVTMRVDGVLVTELRSGFNGTRLATYLCQPIVIVAGDRDDEAYQSLQDVRCLEQATNI